MAWNQVLSSFQLTLFLSLMSLISVIFDPCKACSAVSITGWEQVPPFLGSTVGPPSNLSWRKILEFLSSSLPKAGSAGRNWTRQALSIPENDTTTSLGNPCQSFVKADVKKVFLIFTWNFLCSAQTLLRSNHPVEWTSEIICPLNLHYSYNLKTHKTCCLCI